MSEISSVMGSPTTEVPEQGDYRTAAQRVEDGERLAVRVNLAYDAGDDSDRLVELAIVEAGGNSKATQVRVAYKRAKLAHRRCHMVCNLHNANDRLAGAEIALERAGAAGASGMLYRCCRMVVKWRLSQMRMLEVEDEEGTTEGPRHGKWKALCLALRNSEDLKSRRRDIRRRLEAEVKRKGPDSPIHQMLVAKEDLWEAGLRVMEAVVEEGGVGGPLRSAACDAVKAAKLKVKELTIVALPALARRKIEREEAYARRKAVKRQLLPLIEAVIMALESGDAAALSRHVSALQGRCDDSEFGEVCNRLLSTSGGRAYLHDKLRRGRWVRRAIKTYLLSAAPDYSILEKLWGLGFTVLAVGRRRPWN